ncbi:MAG: adenosyl-hopene transferase HpnH, partial [Chromatiales bacterium]|nr:adenosyl-hopene transferase HpnH [Chromatiales bacterium]
LSKRMSDYEPSPYLTFSIHLDGNQRRHDASVCRDGVYDKAVAVIREARTRGFRVTVNCTLFQDETPEEIAEFMDAMMELDVEGVTMAPGFMYERAPSQEVFMKRKASKELFRGLFGLGRGKKWRFNHSSLYLDFLAGNQEYQCTAWGNPTRNVFGWQRPCYLLVGEGYAKTFSELMNDTDWSKYGVGRNAKCANCMVHCGFEPTAVNDAISKPWKLAWRALRGPKIEGPMAPELPGVYSQIVDSPSKPTGVAADESSSSDRRVA